MAKSPAAPVQSPIYSTDAEIRAVMRKLKRRVSDVESFEPIQVSDRNDPAIIALETSIAETLEDVFGHQTTAYQRYSPAAELDTAGINMNGTPRREIIEGLIQGKARSLALLQQAIRSFQERLEDEFPMAAIRSDFHTSAIGGAMPGAAIVGFSGIEGRGDAASVGTRTAEASVFGFAEAMLTPEAAYRLLTARVAVLEAALNAPRARIEVPIGPGHNGPPEFEPPLSENDILELVDLLKAQTPTQPVDLPKLREVTTAAEERSGQLRKRVDDFADSLIKGAGGELGKKLVQIPWWLAVYTALNAVLDAAAGWLAVLPL